MASVVRRTRKDGTPSYHVKYLGGDGRARWEHVHGGAKAAKTRKAEVELELARSGGRWTPPDRITLTDYAENWLEAHGPRLRQRTRDEYERILKRDILPQFGDLPLAALTRAHVKAFAGEKAAEGLAANTVRNLLAPLRELLASALDDELVRANVAARVKRIGPAPRKVEPPTRAQVEAVIEAANESAKRPITLAATAGLRRGEVFALRWQDVDFEGRTIRVQGTNHRGTITAPKTTAGERLVPMFGSVRQLLLEQKAASRFKRPQDVVFATVVGSPERPDSWSGREWYPALRRAGVEHFTFHSLRHFAVSQLVAQGANILQLARVAGHADPSITLRVYSHLLPDGLAEAAERFDPLRKLAVDRR